jgi:hypothetical protein
MHMVYLAVRAMLCAVAALASTSALAADCGADADEVNAKCYPTLQAAVDAALSTDRPLVLPQGTYRITAPLVIDYSQHAGTGFELISRGATIDATGTGAQGLIVQCSGGSTASPKGCFYFHQEGTLFVNTNSPTFAVRIGRNDFSDAQNSVKFDHLIVNNGGDGGGCRFNYVLKADIYAVCDTAGSQAGILATQMQFSTLKGAASASHGPALAIEQGYVISNTFISLDLEVSPICLLNTSDHASGNAFAAIYKDCPVADAVAPGSTNGNGSLAGVMGGATQVQEIQTQ